MCEHVGLFNIPSFIFWGYFRSECWIFRFERYQNSELYPTCSNQAEYFDVLYWKYGRSYVPKREAENIYADSAFTTTTGVGQILHGWNVATHDVKMWQIFQSYIYLQYEFMDMKCSCAKKLLNFPLSACGK